MPLVPAILASLVALVLCFVPLFDLLGYESAAVLGAVLGVLVLVRTARRFDTGRLAPPLDPRRSQGPLDDFLALLPQHLLLLVPPAAILLLNALRIRNCDIGLGLTFWGVIPAVSIVAGQALAFGVAVLPRWRTPAALLVLPGQVGAFLWRLAWEPPIAGHTWTIGWFAGSIYDEALSLPRALLWARLGVLAGAALLVLGVEVAWRLRGGRRLGPVLPLLLLSLATVGFLHHQRHALGIEQDQASVQAALGGHVQTEHFDIWYDPASLDAEGRALLVQDHEFRYDQLRSWFQEDPVALWGRRIDSFVYPDRGAQQRLMGSRGTLVARPWTHQMHIRWSGMGDTALTHELAHLFTAPFGRGPTRLAMGAGGLVPDMALIEGVATAAQDDPDELSLHQASRALRQLHMAPDLRQLFDPAGFWSQPGGRAYTVAGSFVQWFVDTYGVQALERGYGSGDLAGAVGQPLDVLVAQWEAFVDQVPLTEAEQTLAQYRYRRQSIFQKVCARTMAELQKQASTAEARGQLDQALAIREQLRDLQPKSPELRLDLARLRARMGEHDAALEITARLLERDDLGPVRTVDIQELAADLRWQSGAADSAAHTYTACVAEGLDEARLRRLAAKAEGAGSASPQARARAERYFLGEDLNSGARLWAALQWAQARPGDPLPRYLVGRVLNQDGDHADAVTWLDGPAGALPQPALDDERRLQLADAAFRGGQPEIAARAWQELLTDSDSSRVLALARDGLARLDWLRRTGALPTAPP